MICLVSSFVVLNVCLHCCPRHVQIGSPSFHHCFLQLVCIVCAWGRVAPLPLCICMLGICVFLLLLLCVVVDCFGALWCFPPEGHWFWARCLKFHVILFWLGRRGLAVRLFPGVRYVFSACKCFWFVLRMGSDLVHLSVCFVVIGFVLVFVRDFHVVIHLWYIFQTGLRQ